MDDGRLTDGQGPHGQLPENTVLIMTSNIPGGNRKACRRHFKPEFVKPA